MRLKPANEFEGRILGAVLIELRKAMKLKAQVTIIIDPFLRGGGAHIGAYPNTNGCTYEMIDEPPKKASRKASK